MPIKKCSICSRKREVSSKTKNGVLEHQDDILELPTVQPLMGSRTRYTTCKVDNLPRQVNQHPSSTTETVRQIAPPVGILNCTEFAVYQRKYADASNYQLADRGRISSVDFLSSYVSSLPVQCTSM